MGRSLTLPRPTEGSRRCTITVEGVVQGVGFRPFVYRLAQAHGLSGSVRNGLTGVLIEVQGAADAVAGFLEDLFAGAPTAARPGRLTLAWGEPHPGTTTFTIDPSACEGAPALFPAPDLAVCEACLRELRDPLDRRYGYPFLNCTACGPRFTIIGRLPYDRERTSMAGFAMCPTCRAEYEDPGDRRFHAEPTACAACGPRLALLDPDGRPARSAEPLSAAAAALREGAILAVKGLGGYHLACDATSGAAVGELRRRKAREAKPLAVMVGSLEDARRLCVVSDADARLLGAPERPIVLLERRGTVGARAVADAVAPGLRQLGLMLPYTPLHHLLLEAVGVPLVMTSGNRSDEPIACEEPEALNRLRGIADLFLVHDRPIRARCDDSVARIARGAPMLLRRARGYVPLAIPLPCEAPRPILACGGELKSVFALARRRDAFLSQHLGDLADEGAWRAWLAAVAHFERVLEIAPAIVVHDLHPGYRATAYARSLEGVQRIGVQHHHAHVAACLADNGVDRRVIGVAWDGTGYGAAGGLWGGEFLLADLAGFERVGHLEEVPLPGGEAAIREPWRMAAVFLRAAYGGRMDDLGLDFARRLDRPGWRLLSRVVERGLNAPLTSSAGRLFDAVASLLGLRDRVAFEAQAAMELEALAAPEADRLYAVRLDEPGGPIVVRTVDVVRGVVEDLLAQVEPGRIAARFHATLADVIARVCARVRERTGIARTALSGGVFQNAWLARAAVARLEAAGFEVHTHRQVPPNDGGLALGQAAVAARLTADRSDG
jgi:hydrogenase maturation protein HypF